MDLKNKVHLSGCALSEGFKMLVYSLFNFLSITLEFFSSLMELYIIQIRQK